MILSLKSIFCLVLMLGGMLLGWIVNDQKIAGGDSLRWNDLSPNPVHIGAWQEPKKQDPVFPPKTDLVKDWKQPAVTLFVTGNQNGYIEPCGCTGLENQKGGLMRRADCQMVLKDRGWDIVSIDAGKQVRRIAAQANLKLQATYQTLCGVMNYDVIAFGPDELKLSDTAQAILNNVEDFENSNPFTCANLVVLDESISNRFRVFERNGKRIGVTTILGDEYFNEIQTTDVIKTAAALALSEIIPKLQQEKCDMLVLVCQASKEISIQLAKRFPVFDLVVTSDGAGEPMMLPEKFAAGNRTTNLIEVGTKGMYVGLVGCDWENGQLAIRYERVPMDARFADNVEAKKIFVNYQGDLEKRYLNPAGFRFADITPRAIPNGGEFAGSESCADCHDVDYDIWKDGIDGNGGPHARATLDLVDPKDNPRAEIKRNFDPECLSCHVTGWNPQEFFPYQTGYYDFERDEHLHGNGCENCHGPGKAHVDAENGDIEATDEEIAKYRKDLFITKADAQKNGTCLACHDTDNSPDFAKKGFDEYWKHIEHGKK